MILTEQTEEQYDQEAKKDAGKLRISLVPPEIIRAIARVRMFAVSTKYKDPENWKRVVPARYKDALLRHILAWWEDEDSVDEESGLNHLDHAATNIAFLIQIREDRRNSDGNQNG